MRSQISRHVYLIYGKSIGLVYAVVPLVFITLGQVSIYSSVHIKTTIGGLMTPGIITMKHMKQIQHVTVSLHSSWAFGFRLVMLAVMCGCQNMPSQAQMIPVALTLLQAASPSPEKCSSLAMGPLESRKVSKCALVSFLYCVSVC